MFSSFGSPWTIFQASDDLYNRQLRKETKQRQTAERNAKAQEVVRRQEPTSSGASPESSSAQRAHSEKAGVTNSS